MTTDSNSPALPHPEEMAELLELVKVADALGGLIHAVNNHLNRIVLQAATMQLQAPPSLHQELSLIRAEGSKAAACLRPIQQLRYQAAGGDRSGDLAALLAVVGKGFPNFHLQPSPAGAAIPLPAARFPLARMLRYLMELILAPRVFEAPTLNLEVVQGPGTTTLRLEVLGTDESLRNDLHYLATPGEERSESLELEALASLIRLLDSRLEIHDLDQDKVTAILAWNE